MSAAVTIVAVPVAALTLLALLRSRFGMRLVAEPSGERWHEQATPTFGGVGIYAGFLAAVALALAVGAVDPGDELFGIVGGGTLLFLAGVVDDLRHLGPLAKLAAQVVAAVIVIASGLKVEIIGNDWIALAVGLVWLVGITNAFNLLDNMDGLAATLAAIACATLAVDAVTEHPNRVVLVIALSLGLACIGFLPFNMRPGRSALVFMGDSGSQLLGFTLAALALASSWKVAGTTATAVVLPLLVLAVPILDTSLVTVRRLIERRPVTQGGRDHSSHRLVYYGLSESRAVALLALIAAGLGATGIAYNVLGNGRVTTVGVLVTFVLLVQFAGVLGDLEERSRGGGEPGVQPSLRALLLQPRRLIEVLVDFGAICTAFVLAYLLLVGGRGTSYERAVFLSTLPVLLGATYVAFVVCGIYRRVWRFAGARDFVVIGAATISASVFAYAVVAAQWDFREYPQRIFVVDAVLCALLVGASRLGVRLVRRPARSGTARQVLIVGAGRFGRSLARELRETPGRRVVGFVDDNRELRRRRIVGVTVLGRLDEIARLLGEAAPDEVLVTVPGVPRERLELVIAACEAARVPCNIVRRETVSSAHVTLEVASK